MKFEIGETVKMVETEEVGRITGVAQYESSPDSYYIRYRGADGRQCHVWWNEDDIEKVE